MYWASIRRSFIAVIIFCLVFGGTFALAQSGTTSLRGTVLDNRAQPSLEQESSSPANLKACIATPPQTVPGRMSLRLLPLGLIP
jgi:hypothetical protein